MRQVLSVCLGECGTCAHISLVKVNQVTVTACRTGREGHVPSAQKEENWKQSKTNEGPPHNLDTHLSAEAA